VKGFKCSVDNQQQSDKVLTSRYLADKQEGPRSACLCELFVATPRSEVGLEVRLTPSTDSLVERSLLRRKHTL
jgi:hypothetical protein